MGCSRTAGSPLFIFLRSNNTNKWDAQEHIKETIDLGADQIIPINGMLKNHLLQWQYLPCDQIIPINGMLKNDDSYW